jgi:phosphoenolpyruvate synthase/pyruvate phosphate dikinase
VSFYQQEEFQLIETTDLAAHQAKYFWLKNSYGHVEVLGEEFFKSRQAELIKAIQAPSPRELRQRAKAAKTDLQKQYDLPATLMKRAKLISDNIVWQDHRKRIMSENFHYKKLLLEELARRTGCQYADLVNLGFDEAIEILRAKRIAKRSSYHGVQFHKTLTRLSDEQAETYWHQYAHHATENVDTIQGVVASTGNKSIMRGRVRVLRSSHDILKPGEILVTAMTSPGYVFAMRQAAAVVTDIGGLTSHAAIVAREIGIPCIVGTKTASRVLKTGDMITIDVLRGIIKLVNEE